MDVLAYALAKKYAKEGLAKKADIVNGKIPADELPSYVDDIVEYASRSEFPAEGETGKIYVADDTGFTYRWSGSEYVQINARDSVLEFASLSAFPQTGAVETIYVALDTNRLYRWDDTTSGYVELGSEDDIEVVKYQTTTSLTDEQVAKARVGKLAVYYPTKNTIAFVIENPFNDSNIYFETNTAFLLFTGTYFPRTYKHTYVRLKLDTSTKLLSKYSDYATGFIYDDGVNIFGNTQVPDSDGKQIARALNLRRTQDMLTPNVYSASSTYDVGDYAIYQNQLYRCTTAITVAEAWNASHWVLTDLGEELKTKQNTLSIATTSTAGIVKSTTTGTVAGRDYDVEVKNDGTMKVNVPWTDTTYQMATNDEVNRLFETEYQISASVTHGTIAGDSTIWSGETTALTITPDAGYSLPSSVTVTGATSSYDSVSGIIILSGATQDVTVVVECEVAPYEIGFRGMAGSQTSLTRTGQAVGATWSANSGVISINGIDLTKIIGGYVGNDGEALTWDGENLKYMNGNSIYFGDVFVKINRFFIKPYYDQNSKLDGFDLNFGNIAPSGYEDWFLGKDHCVIGCYKARSGPGAFTNGLQSKQSIVAGDAGAYPITANNIVTAYKKNSSTVYSLHEKWYNENAILQVLFMALFATKQTTDVFPEATFRHPDNDTRATGYMDSYRAQSLFAYEPTGNSGKRGNMFLGIEDFVGWGLELVAGVKLNGNDICSTTDYANFSYSETYQSSDVNLSSFTSGLYISEMQKSDNVPGLFVPKTGIGSGISYANQYFCDRGYVDGNCWFQGAEGTSSIYGIFYFAGNSDSSMMNSQYAARLCGLPL